MPGPSSPQADDIARNRSLERAAKSERKRLFDFIRRRISSEADAEDILQDVFYQLVTSYSVTEPIEKLTSWLYTVARNRITDWYRKRRFERVSPTFEESSIPLDLEQILFDPQQNPDEVFFRSLVWRELAEALDDLPEKQREVFVMHELEGRSFKEIAEQTGESINTLLSRKRYAVLYLKERLQELYDDMRNL
jgi:RNA polymerase sigma factor (sigma-70 family)